MNDRKKMFIMSNAEAENNEAETEKGASFADLPYCLLQMILSYLVLKDNIVASAVCKEWLSAAKSVRVVEKHPWVISFPEKGDLVRLFDPLQRKLYTLNLPETTGANVLFSKDGWLLMFKTSLKDMLFFNPYTRELITLPKCDFPYQAIAFSSAPTSGTCALVGFKCLRRNVISISICYPGTSSEWITKDFPVSLDFVPYMHKNVVYANDHFYCFTSGGVLFDFDLASQTLSYQSWEEHRTPDIHAEYWLYDPKRVNLMEQKWDLFLMYTCASERLEVYKLIGSKWEEMSSTTLGGVTIFTSLYSTETRLNIPGMRNIVYFPKYCLKNKKCVTYLVEEGGYDPRQYTEPVKVWETQKELCPVRVFGSSHHLRSLRVDVKRNANCWQG